MSIWIKTAACLLLTSLAGVFAAPRWAQEPQPKPVPSANEPKPDDSATGKPPAAGSMSSDDMEAASAMERAIRRLFENSAQSRDYSKVVTAFRSAQEGPAKDAAKADLRKKLADIFDADMKSRKAQADEIESRLKKLQDQYKAREAAKDSIIDLQLQVLEKDADGLGFPGASAKETMTLPDLLGGSRYFKPARDISLAELKTSYPSIIEDLTRKGVFVVSGEGASYAYANVTRPNGPSMLFVRDSHSGKVLAEAQVGGVVKEIRFQEGGLAVRESDGKFVVRVPLGSAANVSRNPEMGSPDGKMSERYRPLGELKKAEPLLVENLTKRGHFAESADGKFHAFANVNYPNGPSHVYLVESATGKPLAQAAFEKPIQKLEFASDGIKVTQADGTAVLALPYPEAANRGLAQDSTGNPPSSLLRAALNDGSKTSEFSDFETLKRRFTNAQKEMNRVQVVKDDTAALDRKEGKDASDEALQQRYSQFWDEQYQPAKQEMEIARQLLDAKRKLLQLDVKSAQADVMAAESEVSKAQETHRLNGNDISQIELSRMRSLLEKAKIQYERTATLLELFESIDKVEKVEKIEKATR